MLSRLLLVCISAAGLVPLVPLLSPGHERWRLRRQLNVDCRTRKSRLLTVPGQVWIGVGRRMIEQRLEIAVGWASPAFGFAAGGLGIGNRRLRTAQFASYWRPNVFSLYCFETRRGI